MVATFQLVLLSLSSVLLTEAGGARQLLEDLTPTSPGEIYKVSRLANYALSLNFFGRPTYDILGRVLSSKKRVHGLDSIYYLTFTTYPTYCPTYVPLNPVKCKRASTEEHRLCQAEIFENHDGKDLRLTKFDCTADESLDDPTPFPCGKVRCS